MIQLPHGYMSPEKVLTPQIEMALMVLNERPDILQQDPSIRAFAMNVKRLKELKDPIYFLEEGLLDQALNTSLAPGITLKDINWPLDGFYLMLPRGRLRALGNCPIGGERPPLSFMTVCKVRKGTVKLASGCEVEVPYNGMSVTIHSAAEDGAIAYSKSFREESDILEVVGSISDSVLLPGLGLNGKRVEFSEDETTFINSLAGLGFNLLAIMSVRPDLVTKGNLIKKIRKKKTKKTEGVYQPSWVGKPSRYPSQKSESTSTSSSFKGWRRGHLRNQPYGPRKENLRKLIWIQPVLCGKNNGSV